MYVMPINEETLHLLRNWSINEEKKNCMTRVLQTALHTSHIVFTFILIKGNRGNIIQCCVM